MRRSSGAARAGTAGLGGILLGIGCRFRIWPRRPAGQDGVSEVLVSAPDLREAESGAGERF